jgi:hypothetical protein
MQGGEIGKSELICRRRVAVLDTDRHLDNLGTFANAANDSAVRPLHLFRDVLNEFSRLERSHCRWSQAR